MLPPLDDELARASSEFDSLDELRADIESGIREQLEEEVEAEFRQAAVDELVKASKADPAGLVVEVRTRELLNAFVRNFESRGIDVGAYLQATGVTPQMLEQRLRDEARQSVARELVLEAVADKLDIEVSDDDIREQLREQGESDSDIEEFIETGGADRVRQDMRMKKAVDRIAAEVKPIPKELAEAREAIWTPEKDKPEPGRRRSCGLPAARRMIDRPNHSSLRPIDGRASAHQEHATETGRPWRATNPGARFARSSMIDRGLPINH